jgi:hypothetical protein
VSVSIGSSSRNHRYEAELLGEKILIERIGTDGDIDKAIAMMQELDGKVDAFGMGGIDIWLFSGTRRYAFRDAKRILSAVRQTPILDGSGLKNSLEAWVINYLDSEGGVPLKGKRVMMTASVDRNSMAKALNALGCQMLYGDLGFGIGIPVRIQSPKVMEIVAGMLLPVFVQLPFKWLYPTGEKQLVSTPRYGNWFAWADVIAGDFLFIWRYMPERLDGKVIITNTVTPENVAELKRRGVHCLVTTTPNLGGRSFGTNVIEAVLVAVSGKRPEELHGDDYLRLIKDVGFAPRIDYLNGDRA